MYISTAVELAQEIMNWKAKYKFKAKATDDGWYYKQLAWFDKLLKIQCK